MRKLLTVVVIIVILLAVLVKTIFALPPESDNVVHLNHKSNFFGSGNALIYPNPFSEITTIYYTPEINESITINLYTSQGILIDELFHQKVTEGKLYEFVLHAGAMEAGIYECVIETRNKVIHQRVQIIH